MWIYNYNDTLCHHGIKGQKWGVRRYQNKDGTLTRAGKRRINLKDAVDGVLKPKDESQPQARGSKIFRPMDESQPQARGSKIFKPTYANSSTSKQKKQLTPEQKEARKKKILTAIVATAAVATVAAATVAYVKNKPAVDKYVKNFVAKTKDKIAANKAKQYEKASKYAENNKAKIFKSPSKLNKYKEFFDKKEVEGAMKSLQQTRDLHNLSQDGIRRGANYIQAFIAYGTAATAVYNLSQSQMFKDAKAKKEKEKKKKSNTESSENKK